MVDLRQRLGKEIHLPWENFQDAADENGLTEAAFQEGES